MRRHLTAWIVLVGLPGICIAAEDGGAATDLSPTPSTSIDSQADSLFLEEAKADTVTDAADEALKKIVLLLPFRDRSKYKGPWDIFGQLPRGLADSLSSHRFFRTLPIDSVFALLSEKERIGKIDHVRAVQIGRQLEADVVVMGEIIDLSMSRVRATVPIGGYRSYQGSVEITLRFYNTIDGTDVGEYEGVAQSDSKRTGVTNPAAHFPYEKEWYLLGESPAIWGSQEFHASLVGQAVGACLHKLVEGMNETVRPPAGLTAFEPKIIDVDGIEAYINVGLADGVRNGDKYGVWDHGRELIDPDTGVALGFALPRRVGVIQVSRILSDHLSHVRILEGESNVEKSFSIRAE